MARHDDSNLYYLVVGGEKAVVCGISSSTAVDGTGISIRSRFVDGRLCLGTHVAARKAWRRDFVLRTRQPICQASPTRRTRTSCLLATSSTLAHALRYLSPSLDDPSRTCVPITSPFMYNSNEIYPKFKHQFAW